MNPATKERMEEQLKSLAKYFGWDFPSEQTATIGEALTEAHALGQREVREQLRGLVGCGAVVSSMEPMNDGEDVLCPDQPVPKKHLTNNPGRN